jgi:hypothetical protein
MAASLVRWFARILRQALGPASAVWAVRLRLFGLLSVAMAPPRWVHGPIVLGERSLLASSAHDMSLLNASTRLHPSGLMELMEVSSFTPIVWAITLI